MTIAARLWLIVLISISGVSGIIVISIIQMRAELITERETKLRNFVEVARSFVQTYEDQVKNSEISIDEAKRRSLGRISALRYGDNDYVWVHRISDSIIQMHPSQELVGTSMPNALTDDGKPLFKTFSDVVREHGSGFISYQWPRPGHKELEPKISYVTGVPEWDWVIGSGTYISDIDIIFRPSAITFAFGGFIAVIFVGLLTYLLARGISRPLVDVTTAIDALSKDNTDVQIMHIGRNDEIGTVSRALAVLRQNTIAMKELRLERKRVRLQAESERQAEIQHLTERFEMTIRSSAESIVETSSTLNNIATDVLDRLAKRPRPVLFILGETNTNNDDIDSGLQNDAYIAKAIFHAAYKISEAVRKIGGVISNSSIHAINIDRLRDHAIASSNDSARIPDIKTYRKLANYDINIYYDHLTRLDEYSRSLRFSGLATDGIIKQHVDQFNWDRDEVIGYFFNGSLRGSVEICYSSCISEKSAELAFSIERKFQNTKVGSRLMSLALNTLYNSRIEVATVICNASNKRMQNIALKTGSEVRVNWDRIKDGDEFIASIDVAQSDVRSLLSAMSIWDRQ